MERGDCNWASANGRPISEVLGTAVSCATIGPARKEPRPALTALANALKARLQYLTGNQPDIAKRIAVHPVNGIAYEMYSAAFGQPNIASSALVRDLLRQAAAQVDSHRLPPPLGDCGSGPLV